MDYLYFDIECCDGKHMCSFGYVLVNDAFDILEKEDLLINPEKPFMLGREGREPWIRLAYSNEAFYRSPTFNDRYDAIERLLTQPGRILLGHSISSDLTYLDTACKRYQKKQFDIGVFDTQKMYGKVQENCADCSLENILKELHIETEHLTEHKSCDDAEKSMLTAKEICARRNIGMEEVLIRYKDCLVNRAQMERAHNYSRIKKTVKGLKRLYRNKGKERACFFISELITPKEWQKRINLVNIAYRKGYGVDVSIDTCTYFVTNGGMSDAERDGYKKRIQKNDAPQVITTDKMAELLHIAVNEYGEAEDA